MSSRVILCFLPVDQQGSFESEGVRDLAGRKPYVRSCGTPIHDEHSNAWIDDGSAGFYRTGLKSLLRDPPRRPPLCFLNYAFPILLREAATNVDLIAGVGVTSLQHPAIPVSWGD